MVDFLGMAKRKKRTNNSTTSYEFVASTQLKKYTSDWFISPYVGLNIKQVWKPPPRSIYLMLLATWDVGFCVCWFIIAPLTNCTGLGFAYFLPWPIKMLWKECVNTPWNWRFCFKNLVSNFGANLGSLQIAFSLLISSLKKCHDFWLLNRP